jgi:hypothetical protein
MTEVEKKWKDPRISVVYFVCPADDAKTAPLYNASPMNSPSDKFVNVSSRKGEHKEIEMKNDRNMYICTRITQGAKSYDQK